MNTATDAIRFIETLQKQGVKKQVATEIVSFVDKQQGDLATKQDIGDLAAKVREIAVKQDYLKWIMGIGFTIMLAGMAALLTLMLYLHGNTNERLDRIEQRIESRFERMEAEMKEIKELLQRK